MPLIPKHKILSPAQLREASHWYQDYEDALNVMKAFHNGSFKVRIQPNNSAEFVVEVGGFKGHYILVFKDASREAQTIRDMAMLQHQQTIQNIKQKLIELGVDPDGTKPIEKDGGF